MDEQKRLLLALVLMAVVVAGVTYLWPSTPAQQVSTPPIPSQPEEEEQVEEPEDQEPRETKRPERELFPEQRLELQTPELVVEVSTYGGGLTKAELLNDMFQEEVDDETHQIDLVSVDLAEHQELMPLAFTLIQKKPSTPASGQSAEGLGVLRLVNNGAFTAEILENVAQIGSDVSTKLTASRPFATLEDLESAIGGSSARKRQILGKLLSAAWQGGFVRLDFELLRRDDHRLVLRGETDNDIEVVRTIDVVDDYEIRIADQLKNRGAKGLHLRTRLGATGREKNVSSSGWFRRPQGQLAGLCYIGDEMVRATRGQLSGEGSGCGLMSCGGSSGGPQQRSGQIRFIAVDRHFFMTALSPSEAWGDTTCELYAADDGDLQVVVEPLVFTEVPAGGRTTYVSTTYLGPKQYDLLRDLGPGRQLWEAINYGWFAVLSHGLLKALRFFHRFLGNWGLSIILLTLIIKLILLPITHKSMKSMRKMQAEMAQFKPQMDEINEKYKDQPDVKQQKMMEFYKEAGFNPFKSMGAGCLPMLLQMPIWIALYRMISESVELYRAPFVLWLVDLSAQDPYYILPGLLGVAMLVQQLLTPQSPGMDETQAKMMRWMMPIMFIVIMINMPAGLVLYIFVNTLLTIVQQQFINRMIPATVSGKIATAEKPKSKDPDASTGDEKGRSSRKNKAKRRKRK